MKPKEPRELVALEKAAEMLDSAASFEDIKSIRDAAIAAQAYVKAARRGLDAQNRVAVIRIRAERKAGEWLARLKLRGGDRKSKSKRRPAPMKLEDLGVTRDESKRWQKEASVPERDFQKYVTSSRRLGQEVSSAGLIRIARGLPSTGNGSSQRSSAANHNGERGTPASASRLAGFPSADHVTIPPVPSNGSSEAKQLIHEIEDHHQLLTSMLAPIYANGDTTLKLAERRHLKYLLGEIQRALQTLNRLV